MITDTHCHIYYDEIKSDIENVLKRAEETGIKKIIVPAVDFKTSIEILELSEKYEMIYALVGIHPTEVAKTNESDLDKVFDLLKYEKVVGIGESGLDYYWDKSGIDKQKEFFIAHINKAKEIGKPIVIHTRDSTSDAIDIIKTNYNENLKGQFHCFSGTIEEAKIILQLNGFYISFCGNITYKNNKDSEVVKFIPSDRLLSETDSPFLTPVPNRGKTNEPANIIYTIKKIAELKEIDVTELTNNLYKNSEKLFFNK